MAWIGIAYLAGLWWFLHLVETAPLMDDDGCLETNHPVHSHDATRWTSQATTQTSPMT